MSKISISLITTFDRIYVMKYLLRSLVALQPDEIVAVDTTKNKKESAMCRKWLHEEAKKQGLPMKTDHFGWIGDYSAGKNYADSLCSSEWILSVGSDEFLSNELADGLRAKIAELPSSAIGLRVGVLDLVNDTQCNDRLWPKPHLGFHPRVYKRGIGKHGGKIQEVYSYPGRGDVPYGSPQDPVKSWYGVYLLHLQFYKDNVFRRHVCPTVTWAGHDKKEIDEKFIFNQVKKLFKVKGMGITTIPDGVTWEEIDWKIEKEKWFDV